MKIVFSYLICITLLIPSFSFSQEKVEKKIEITLDHNILYLASRNCSIGGVPAISPNGQPII